MTEPVKFLWERKERSKRTGAVANLITNCQFGLGSDQNNTRGFEVKKSVHLASQIP